MEPTHFDGTLAKWNEERGFGFIAPAQGGQEIFVHASAFPRDGRPPRVNEALSFAVELNNDGKKRATGVRRPTILANTGQTGHRRYAGHPSTAGIKLSRKPRATGSRVVMVMIVLALGAYAYKQYERQTGALSTPVSAAPGQILPAPDALQRNPHARCDGRTYCSQMTSCTEAKFFLKNCPGTHMDGNHDGVPCEQQWCTSPFAK